VEGKTKEKAMGEATDTLLIFRDERKIVTLLRSHALTALLSYMSFLEIKKTELREIVT